MKLLLAVISKDDADEAETALWNERIITNRIASTGSSFFSTGTSTLLVICEDDKVKTAIDVLKATAGTCTKLNLNGYGSSPDIMSTTEEGGGLVCVLNTEDIISL